MSKLCSYLYRHLLMIRHLKFNRALHRAPPTKEDNLGNEQEMINVRKSMLSNHWGPAVRSATQKRENNFQLEGLSRHAQFHALEIAILCFLKLREETCLTGFWRWVIKKDQSTFVATTGQKSAKKRAAHDKQINYDYCFKYCTSGRVILNLKWVGYFS